jgi:rhodanese-related sulfurtransferase
MNILIIRRLILHILIGLIFLLTINTNAFSCGWAGENDGDDIIETIAVGVDGNPVPDLDDDIEDPSFQNKMGNIYRLGIDVKPNLNEAIKWYKKAADQNYAPSINNLANMYESGLGVKKNQFKAFDLFKIAAEQNHPEAQHSLAQMYLEGRGIKKDERISTIWLLKSANNGHASAMRQAGVYYWNGTGGEKDRVKAYHWWIQAMQNGDKKSFDLLRNAKIQMTEEQLKSANSIPLNMTFLKKKKIASGLYLTAIQAYNKWKSNPKGTIILDTRTREEYVFLGHAQMAYNVPVKFISEKWGTDPFGLEMLINRNFIKDVKRNVEKSDTIFVMCRSGVRSALAGNLLYKAGFTNVYNVIDGFEGDKNKHLNSPEFGKRIINGWKSSKLPWTYDLDEELVYYIN